MERFESETPFWKLPQVHRTVVIVGRLHTHIGFGPEQEETEGKPPQRAPFNSPCKKKSRHNFNGIEIFENRLIKSYKLEARASARPLRSSHSNFHQRFPSSTCFQPPWTDHQLGPCERQQLRIEVCWSFPVPYAWGPKNELIMTWSNKPHPVFKGRDYASLFGNYQYCHSFTICYPFVHGSSPHIFSKFAGIFFPWSTSSAQGGMGGSIPYKTGVTWMPRMDMELSYMVGCQWSPLAWLVWK